MINLITSNLLVSVIAALLLTWVILIITTRIWYGRKIGRPIFGKVIHVVPYASLDEARQAADDRRYQVRNFLSEQSGVPKDFLEIPPNLPTSLLQQGQSLKWEEAAFYWHTSRLHLQLEKDHYLLIERVTDALVCLYLMEKITPDEFPSTVRLEKVPRWKAWQKFPWRVVIVTNNPQALTDWFKEETVQRWFGIGIDVVKPYGIGPPNSSQESQEIGTSSSGIVPYGRCQTGTDGLNGLVAGLVRQNGRGSYGITCRHVLSSTCSSIFWPASLIRPANQEFTQESPDAAFIEMCGAGCFFLPGRPSRQTPVFNLSDIELAAHRQTKLKMIPKRGNVFGIVQAVEVSGIKLGDYFYRGLHIEITPYFYKRFGIVWPRSRRFSVTGDSGSWVVDTETRAWVGMIIGGCRPPNTQTYAIAGYYLVDAFQRYSNSRAAIVSEIFL